MTELKIEYIPIDSITPYEANAKLHPAEQIEQIKKSIQDYGFRDPVGIWKDEIVEGHGRIIAAKELGMKEVPVIRLDDMTDEQRREYALVHNQTTLNSGFDFSVLDAEIEGLPEFDAAFYGFELPETVEEKEIVEDEAPEDVETRCKLGDLWELGKHRLICGDSTDVTVIDRLMDGAKADMVFTDPPYSIQTEGGHNGDIGKSLWKQGRDIEFIADFEPTEFLNILPTVFDGNMNAYIFCNKELLPDYLNWCRDNGYSWNVLIWKKPNGIPINSAHRPDTEYLLFFRKNAIWNTNTNANYSRCLQYGRVKKSDENGGHPTLKPIELIANELKISSNKNSGVVDLFGGSGSTLIACEQLNRKCYMSELDPHYCDVIIQRWENFTGEKAVLLNE